MHSSKSQNFMFHCAGGCKVPTEQVSAFYLKWFKSYGTLKIPTVRARKCARAPVMCAPILRARKLACAKLCERVSYVRASAMRARDNYGHLPVNWNLIFDFPAGSCNFPESQIFGHGFFSEHSG